MSNLITSPEYAPIHIDDVSQIFETILAKRPSFSSLVAVRGVATNHKHEWLEYKKEQTGWVVDGQSNSASAALVLDSTVGVVVGDVLGFTAPTGASHTVSAKVTTVTNTTDLVISRLGTDENILDNSIVFLISRAKPENSTQNLDTNVKPSRVFNYTQIFRRDLALSRSVLQTALYGLATEADRSEKVEDLINFQVINQLNNISFELNHSMISGIKAQRVDGGENGRLGGLLQFLTAQAGSQLDASAAQISQTILNNAIEQAVNNGADGTQLTVLLCHPVQARKISSFNTSGNNPIITRTEEIAGSFVAQYKSDLAATNGGALTTIVVDRNFPQDQVAILNMGNLALTPMQNFFVQESTDPKDDGRTFKLLGEVTMEFRNAADDAMLIINLGL